MKRDRKPLSDAELSVLKLLWDLGPSPVRKILDAMSSRDWAYTTGNTILARLEDKGYVETDRSSQPHIYRPILRRDELVKYEVERLRSRICDGEGVPLVQALVRGDSLSTEDIRELRAYLDELLEAGG